MLLISEKVLDCKRLNEVGQRVSWETCTLRQWLNSSFLNETFTDKEKDNLSKNSSNLFTLNTFYTVTKRLSKIVRDNNKCEQFQVDFWNNVVVNMREWNEMESGDLSKKSLRENYITTQGLIILSLGRLCEFYYNNPDIDLKQSLTGLRNIDWLRNNNKDWHERAIKVNGRINRNEQGIFLTYIQIKRLLNLPIDKKEIEKEKCYIN